MMLEIIFKSLRERGLCTTQKDYSRNWLHRTAAYYAVVHARGDADSLATLLMLHRSLSGSGQIDLAAQVYRAITTTIDDDIRANAS